MPEYISFISAMACIFYVLGEMKAGDTGGDWKTLHFIDGSELPGAVIGRTRDGLIVQMADYFAFDSGQIFVPFSSILMISELQRSEDGSLELPSDFSSKDSSNAVTEKP